MHQMRTPKPERRNEGGRAASETEAPILDFFDKNWARTLTNKSPATAGLSSFHKSCTGLSGYQQSCPFTQETQQSEAPTATNHQIVQQQSTKD